MQCFRRERVRDRQIYVLYKNVHLFFSRHRFHKMKYFQKLMIVWKRFFFLKKTLSDCDKSKTRSQDIHIYLVLSFLLIASLKSVQFHLRSTKM